MRDQISTYLHDLAQATHKLSLGKVQSLMDTLLACHARGNTVFILGNGGSAATASHFACDLAKGARAPGLPAFRVVALTDNVPLLTAWGNDTSYDRVFAEQLAALARAGDVVICISASGNSPNVLAVPEVARQVGATTVALTGETGGKLGKLVDLVIRVPAQLIEQVEDAHLIIAHSVCVALRQQLCAQTVATVPATEQAALYGIVSDLTTASEAPSLTATTWE